MAAVSPNSIARLRVRKGWTQVRLAKAARIGVLQLKD
jgi:hypothetical protein